MIFIYSDLINQDFALFLTLVAATVFALLIGIGFHEFCHAFMATERSCTSRRSMRSSRTMCRCQSCRRAHLAPTMR